ncbi:hypothetical protein Ahy_B03g062444 isoform B [Arachis hypogaea]|nr:hypothetical protein Ahy_B03g062444 isoform B [Arachis hypogaea]
MMCHFGASPDYILVEEIVQHIWRRLKSNYSTDYQGLVGIHNHIAQIHSLLHVELEAVRIIGICGIGGIGLIVLNDCSNLELFSISITTKDVVLHGCSRSRSIESLFRNCLPGSMIRCMMGTRGGSLFESFSDTFDPNGGAAANLDDEPMDNIHLLNLKVLREGLEELSLHGCRSLVFIPSSIGRLSKLCILDLTYCEALESLPSSIFNLKLTKLDLHGCSMLKNLPEITEPAESFAHMNLAKTAIKEIPSSLAYLVGLQTLQLNLCKDLEFLPNSIGSAVPHWFPNRCKGHSVTLKQSSLNWCSDNRFIGFALCVVFGLEGMHDEECKYSVFSYRFTYECDDGIHVVPSNDQLRYYFNWKGRQRFILHDHTFIWKSYLETQTINHMLSHNAHNFSFQICKYDVGRSWPNYRPSYRTKVRVNKALFGWKDHILTFTEQKQRCKMGDHENGIRLEPERQKLLNEHSEKHFTAGEIVRDIIIGVSDGLTVPFALAAGLSGANATSSIVLTAGIAEVAAGAISMGLGGYLAAKSESDHYKRELKREQEEIITVPDTEAAEVAEILAQYGIEAHEYGPVVSALRKNPQAWLDFMMK